MVTGRLCAEACATCATAFCSGFGLLKLLAYGILSLVRLSVGLVSLALLQIGFVTLALLAIGEIPLTRLVAPSLRCLQAASFCSS